MRVTSGRPAAITTTLLVAGTSSSIYPSPAFAAVVFFSSKFCWFHRLQKLCPATFHTLLTCSMPLSTRPPTQLYSTLLFSSAILLLALCISFQGISQIFQFEKFFLYSGKLFPQPGHCLPVNPDT